jgi:hypothetical protein
MRPVLKTSADIEEQSVKVTGFLLDYKLFRFETDSEGEPFYLASLLNTSIIDKLIKPMSSRGLWGPRDICKKVLGLPIPRFNAENNVQPHKPLVAESVFLQTPGTHIEGILRARIQKQKTKSFVEPEAIGQKTSILFGPATLGGKSIELKAREMGINLNEKEVNAIIDVVRRKLDTVESVSDGEVESIILSISR